VWADRAQELGLDLAEAPALDRALGPDQVLADQEWVRDLESAGQEVAPDSAEDEAL
jgi:hypothetical protein